MKAIIKQDMEQEKINEQALVESKPEYQLTRPEDIQKFSKVLSDFITKSQLSTKIQGNKYVNVDGWKFAGLNFGLVPIVKEPISKGSGVITILFHESTYRTKNGTQKTESPYFASSNPELVDKFRKDTTTRELTTDYFNYSCGCDVINSVNGTKVGSGFGLCSNLELKKVNFDEYAVQSMSQTRSIGRAFKNIIGFIIQAAGYDPTPSEEMDSQKGIIVVEGDTMIDIDAQLKNVKTIDELTLLWENLPPGATASNKVKNSFTRKKTKLKANKK